MKIKIPYFQELVDRLNYKSYFIENVKEEIKIKGQLYTIEIKR